MDKEYSMTDYEDWWCWGEW